MSGGASLGPSARLAVMTLLLEVQDALDEPWTLESMAARAGYDPRDLAKMFEAIERESKGSTPPQWLSSHPNPGNRVQYIRA